MNWSSHTVRQYDEQLRLVRDRLKLMHAYVDAAIERAVGALLRDDRALARKTMERDDILDRFESEINEACLVLLATRAPLASDLRFVTTATKVATDIERIGDLAVSICERVLEAEGHPPLAADRRIAEMTESVRETLATTMQAFLNGDVALASSVLEREDEISRRYREVFEDMIELMTRDVGLIRHGIRMQSVAKRLEHMSDLTLAIANETVHMLEG